MKKLLCILTAALSLTSYSAFPIQPVQAADDMSKTAQEIVDDIVIGWNLGNTLEEFKSEISDDPYFYETSCAQPITTKKMILDVKEAGFNAIRIPVTWYQKLDENNNISEAWMNRIQEVVDYAYDEGMYVIINIHHDTNHGWIQADYDSWDTYQDRYAAIWTQIANRFKDYAYNRYSVTNGFVGVPDDNTLFVLPQTYCDDIIKKANGNIAIIEEELGFPSGYFKDGGGLVRIDVDDVADLNLRIPNGNETGANTLWVPGGYTYGGIPEAVSDTIPLSEARITTLDVE